MRKPDKAALGTLLMKKADTLEAVQTSFYVLHGGSSLHRVKWPKLGTYMDVINLYLLYIRKFFTADVTVVFDGYDSGPRLMIMSMTAEPRQLHLISK